MEPGKMRAEGAQGGVENASFLRRYVLENFERALAESRIKVFYQPIVRVATGEVCDEEVLARWVDPEQGIISPVQFIPVLEEARLIHRLDLYIARRACQLLAAAIEEGVGPTSISLNLSPLDFELCDIVSEIEAIVDGFGLAHSLVSLEVTESALADNQELFKSEVDRFRALGFEVWMDDFGSGYSTLNILKDYNFDLIKVDMGFLRGFEQSERGRIVLAHIIGMAKELGIKTLVEGVETSEQCDFLRSIGCGRAQGYFFGKPTSASEVWRANLEGAYLPFELPGNHDFYEAVGRVNLLRPDPVKEPDGHYVPSDVPVAILRRTKGVYEYLNVTDVYHSFLHEMGVASLRESEHRLNDTACIERQRFDEGMSLCCASGDWEWVTYYGQGKYCSLRMRCIAQDAQEDTVAVMVVAVGVQDSLPAGTA